MPDQTDQPSLRLSLVLLILLALLAAALRLPNLSAQGLWYDEAATWSQVSGSFYAMLSDTVSDNYPPLYNTVTWLFVQALGEAEWVLRLPAALFGLALVPMIYLLGARVGGRTAGLLAALLVALSSFHLWYSLEARMYSLLALTACAYIWATLRDAELQTRSSGWTLVGTGFALLLSHPYGALDWIAVSATALLLSPRRGHRLGYFAITWLLFLPFALALLAHAWEITGRGFWIPEPTPGYILKQFSDLTSSLLPALVICAVAACIPRPGKPLDPALAILVSIVVIPPILAYMASLLTRPVFLDRYLIGSLPALFVLAATGVTRWLTGRWVLLGAAAVAVAATASFVYAPQPPRPDWRSAIASIRQTLQPDDCIILRPRYNQTVWRYYADTGCTARTVSQAFDRAALRHLIYAAGNAEIDQAELDDIASRTRLLDTRRYEGVTVYEFGKVSTQ